jgi:hypothetical protein
MLNKNNFPHDRVRAAVADALVSRGPNKGSLKKTAPRWGTDGYVAWQALEMVANPYKVSIGGLLLLNSEQRALYDLVLAGAEANAARVRGADRDRVALESLGAW